VVPPRRERESREHWIDDPASAVGTVQAVRHEELSAPSLGPPGLGGAWAIPLDVVAESFQYVDGCVEGTVRGSPVALAIPSTIVHLLTQEVGHQSFAAGISDPEPGQEPQDQAGDARLAPLLRRCGVDTAIAPQALRLQDAWQIADVRDVIDKRHVPSPKNALSNPFTIPTSSFAVGRVPLKEACKPASSMMLCTFIIDLKTLAISVFSIAFRK